MSISLVYKVIEKGGIDQISREVQLEYKSIPNYFHYFLKVLWWPQAIFKIMTRGKLKFK